MFQIKKVLVICVGLLGLVSAVHAQSSSDSVPVVLYVENERPVIEGRNALYSKYLLAGDSLAIASIYTSDGKIGCKTGAEILSAAGKWIRNNIKNDSRYVTFKTVTLNSDGDLLIETGLAEARSDKGALKYTFRYLVVWKKEDGLWKIYRDVGL